MISNRPMMDLKGWGKNPLDMIGNGCMLFGGLSSIVGIVVGIFGRAFGLGLQAALLLYAFFGKFIQPNTNSFLRFDHEIHRIH